MRGSLSEPVLLAVSDFVSSVTIFKPSNSVDITSDTLKTSYKDFSLFGYLAGLFVDSSSAAQFMSIIWKN